MTAREAVFAALGADRTAPDIAREAAALLTRVPRLRPDRVGANPVESFLARITGPVIAATSSRIGSLAEVPGAVRAYLDTHQLRPQLALQPEARLAALDWSGFETHRGIAVDEAVSVCLAPYAIAETGSLVFRSSPEMPVLFAFLPVHHLVVVEAPTIVPWLEDCAAIEAQRPPPRNLVLVTGASGTTDIEGALVRGAHGPAHLHVILIESSLPVPQP